MFSFALCCVYLRFVVVVFVALAVPDGCSQEFCGSGVSQLLVFRAIAGLDDVCD